MSPRAAAPAQLDLFAVGLPSLPASEDFVKGVAIDRQGIARYVHLIRAAGDPERSGRPEGGRADRAPHRTLARTTTEEHWASEIGRLLGDGVPRTFNRIGVELLDQTADMLLGSPLDTALWQMVASGTLEHTMEAPIFFRLPPR